MEKIDIKPRYIFTKHFRKRYCERFLDKEFTGFLSKEEDKSLLRLVLNSKIDPLWFDNMNFITYIKQKYKDKKFVLYQTETLYLYAPWMNK